MASTYTTTAGDTWDAIAYSEMGDERYLDQLILANRAHAYYDRLPAGLALAIPDAETPDTSPSLPPWRQT